MQENSKNWISCKPPLAVEHSDFGDLKLQGIRQDTLLFSGSDATRNVTNPSLKIKLPESREVLHLSGKWIEKHGQWTYRADPKNLKDLKDLISRLRKDQHIAICKDQEVESTTLNTGFAEFHLVPCALPELDWSEINTEQSFFGYAASAPLLITGMTGGVSKAEEINRNLAYAAEKHCIPMGVGSQRLALENPNLKSIFQLKSDFPNLFLIANIGAAQLIQEDPLKLCDSVVEMIDADALAIHMNITQELIQAEGDRNFKGILQSIERIRRHFGDRLPVYTKEVGTGLDPQTARRLHEVGISLVDVGGAGGTSWTKIEGLRSGSKKFQRLGELFQGFGIPTAEAIQRIKAQVPQLDIIATGGIRNGLDMAKAIGLGAHFCGVGLPLFRKSLISADAVDEEISFFIEGYKTALMATGSATHHDLNSKVFARELNGRRKHL